MSRQAGASEIETIARRHQDLAAVSALAVPDSMASEVSIASAWLEENRDWIESGGSGDLHRLVRLLAEHQRQQDGHP